MTLKPNSTPADATEKIQQQLQLEERSQLPLVRTNFIIMIAAAVMIVLGFVLMTGSPSTETEFNPDIFSTRRIVIGPLFAFLGFVAMAVGIIWRVKPQQPAQPEA